MTFGSTLPSKLEMSAQEFQLVANLASDIAGLSIPDTKMSLVQSRLSKRMRQVGMSSFGEYLARVAAAKVDSSERKEFLSALTTNVSSFYRESHHFEFFTKHVIPGISHKLAAGEKVRIWSAGCSSGQEPYSIAMELLLACPDAQAPNVLILGSDIDPEILARAKSAQYTEAEIDGIPADRRGRFLEKTPDGRFEMCGRIRSLIRFKELNLHGQWPMTGPFDAIFCRNVVIYFDETRQQALWPRFNGLLQKGGHLFLGHSERIHPLNGTGFESAGVTTYRKQ